MNERDLLDLMRRDPLPELGPTARPGGLTTAQIDAVLSRELPSLENGALKKLLQASLYLWHDHLDESHGIAQAIETVDGSLIHAIMHRREPDYGNAKYWFRRCSTHPSFASLSVRAEDLLKRSGDSDLQSRLVPNKSWDPFAFVDAVEDAMGGRFRSKIPVLEELQKLEMESLLENLLHRTQH